MTELPDNILHLPDYQVIGAKSDEDDMHFQVEAPTPEACQECGCIESFVKNGKKDVPYRDMPIHGKRVTLWVIRRRYLCPVCKSTFRPKLPQMTDGYQMTARLHDFIEKESFNQTHTYVANQTGLDEKTVREIFTKRAEFLGRWHQFETPRVLGIDELYLNKRYRCILTNLEEKTLLDLLPKRNKPNVIARLMTMPDKHKVEVVSMDMWNPYRDAVKAVFPNAKIVVDKFHVVRMANDCLDKVRKGLRTELTKAQVRTLKGDRKILLKRVSDLSVQEYLIMETWINTFPELKAAHEHKEQFYHVWDAPNRAEAEIALDEWIAGVPKDQKTVWNDLVRASTNWREEIMAYFDTGLNITNAFTESINRLAKDKNRDGRGYSFEVMRARMLYTTRHKKKKQQAKASPFLETYAMGKMTGISRDDARVLNFGVDLSTML